MKIDTVEVSFRSGLISRQAYSFDIVGEPMAAALRKSIDENFEALAGELGYRVERIDPPADGHQTDAATA